MSLESKFYNQIYDKHEKLESAINEIILSHQTNKIQKIKKFHNKRDKLFKGIKYTTAIGALAFGSSAVYDIFSNQDLNFLTYIKTTLASASGCLTSHFHYFEKLDKAIDKKMFQEKKTFNESTIDSWRKRGRYSHAGAITSVIASITPVLYAFGHAHPTLTTLGGSIFGACIYASWIKGYNALYSATADYLKNKRK